jgi:hypothetical protein
VGNLCSGRGEEIHFPTGYEKAARTSTEFHTWAFGLPMGDEKEAAEAH